MTNASLRRGVLLAVVCTSAAGLAAGFRLDTHAARATGMGGAVTALVDDSSGIFYNPAGLVTKGDGLDVRAGVTLIAPALHFRHDDGTESSTPFGVSPPPHLFASYTFLEQLAVGVGLFTPFGSSGNWPADWQGRFKARQSQVQTYDINPTIAYRLHKRARIGLGFNAVRGTVAISRALDFVDSEGEVRLGGDAWGYGWNLGLQAEVVENRVWVGGAYRSGVAMAFKGRAHFENVPPELAGRLADQPIQAAITLPETGSLGIAVAPMEGLRLALDFNFVQWASFKELRIDFENPDLTVPLPKQWFDVVSVHLGGEYQVSKSVQLRLGFVYDPTPSPASTLTPDLPDATRLKVTAGVGWQHQSGFTVDVGYQFVALLANQSTAPTFPGTYSGTAQVLGLTLGYRR